MTKSDNEPILFHLITEGSTDRKILSAIISKILAGRSHDFIEMSSTQKGKRGRQAIINKFVDDAAINKKTDDIKKTESINKLRCLPSFQDFEEQLLYCTE